MADVTYKPHAFKPEPGSRCWGSDQLGSHDFCYLCGGCSDPVCDAYRPANHVLSAETVTAHVNPRPNGHPRFFELLGDMAQLHEKKNSDYAGGNESKPLGNFERVSAIARLYPGMDWDSPFGVAMIYMLKQLDAALVLRSTKRESVTGEPVGSRLGDIATYSLIMKIIEEEERQ